MIGLALAAALFVPQTIDGESEAWSIANRNGIMPSEWTIVSRDTTAAYFVKKGTGRQRWAAAVDASDLSVTLMLMDANCASRQFRFLQTSVRNWLGDSVSDAGETESQYAAPGSVGDLMVEAICKVPPVTLPIEPRR